MVKHIVFFRLKDRSAESIERAAAVLRAMEGKIEFLREIEVGVDFLRSPRSYDIALITVFDSREDLERYQAHPAHQPVSEYMSEVRESSVSVDFEC
ncbi:MAG: Dabb family protein [Bacillota bacterium]